jgi:Family of unknown function (DUF6127)
MKMISDTHITSATLLGLSEQLIHRGADPLILRALIEEASDLGAMRALARLGLSDATAGADMHDVRQLLDAWRTAKSSAWKALVSWCVKLLLAGLLLGLALHLKLITGQFVAH